jgi:hypothetical protein
MFDDEGKGAELLPPHEAPGDVALSPGGPGHNDDGLLASADASIDRSAKMAQVPPGQSTCAVNSRHLRSFGCRPYHQASLVERFAVQRRGRRTSGSLMLLQFLCGDCVRCNGLFDGSTASPV